jgi:hypothetical protein
MKRAMSEILTRRGMIVMANWSEAEIPEGNFIWQLKNKF